VGGFTPDMRETDSACARGAFIVIDTPGALETSGDLIEPIVGGIAARDDIVLLRDLIAQPPSVDSPSARTPAAREPVALAASIPRPKRTIFKTVGFAHADLAAAQALYERYTRDRV
jgi:ornithine cyclodeaminase